MKQNNLKIEGVVILYNPDESILNNIKSYVNEIRQLYIIDNSENKNQKLIDKIKKISNKCIYVDNKGNKGIAYALNVGAKLAIENGSNWLLTMDQDSKFTNNNLRYLIEYTLEKNDKNIGIISPLHSTHLKNSKKLVNEENVMTVMTSGNLINLDAFKLIGGFKEYYFIDAVDWEYCLNLNINNFKVIRFNKSILEHNLGEISLHKNFFHKEIEIYNHNKIRKYYIVRNKLLISKEYFKYFPRVSLSYIKSIFVDFKNVIFYEKDKIEKIKYMSKGICHFFCNKFGKMQ